MVKKIVRISYACSVCGREWPKPEHAQACEASPGPALAVGDVVIWNGVRDDEYRGLQTLVYDVVTEIEIEERFGEPGHEVIYHLSKQHSVRADEIPDARTGYVNLAGNVGLAQLHTDRIGTALRESSASRVDGLVQRLRHGGLPLQPRLGRLYQPLRELEYSHTWNSSAHRYGLRRLPADTAQVLDWIARQPSDDDCLAFIGGWAHDHRGRRPHPNLDEAFDFNHFNTWGALVGYDLDEAFQLLATTPDRELIARVRGYRAGLLAGSTLGGRQVPQGLFRLDEAKASSAWPREVLSWVRARGLKGSGLTRLRRVYEAAIDLSAIEPEVTVTIKPITLWPDQEVLFVLAGKGGVGKSTVSADLARALTATGRRVLVFDADLYGPTMPVLFPVDDPRLCTRRKRIVPHVVDGVEVVSLGHILEADEAVEWRGPWLEAALHMLGSHLDTQADLVLVDLPPGTGDALNGLLRLCPQARLLFVATAGQVALADVRRAINVLAADERARIIGLLSNMAYLDTPGGERVYLWGGADDVAETAADFSLRFLGELPLGDTQTREPVMRQVVLPAVLECLAGRRYQEVDPAVVDQQAEAMLERYGQPTGLERHLAWSVPNLASHLEMPIVRAGGDPNDPRYRRALRAALRRLLRAKPFAERLAPPLSVQTSRPGAWWHDLAVQIHGADVLAAPVEVA